MQKMRQPARAILSCEAERPGFVRTFKMSWSRAFNDPIPLPRGRHLITLNHAAECIQKLPKAEQLLDEWQAAVEALLLVVELNGPTMMARIGMLRA